MNNTVLILEDNKELMESYLDILDAFTSAYPIACHSVKEVYALRDSVLKTKIAFLDLNLATPQESGLDVAQWLKDNGYEGKIYFLTGQVHDSKLISEIKKIDAEILSKPFDIEQFIGLVDSPSDDEDSFNSSLN